MAFELAELERATHSDGLSRVTSPHKPVRVTTQQTQNYCRVNDVRRLASHDAVTLTVHVHDEVILRFVDIPA